MKNKIVIITLSFLSGILLLNSCLKDDVGDYWKDEVAGKMYAQVVDYTLQQKALQPTSDTVGFTFLVNIATDALPSEDITLVLSVDTSAVSAYNSRTNKSYKPFPFIEVLTPTIVIEKGTRNAYVSGRVWGAEGLNACDNFIGAISISSATTASGKSVTIAGNMKSYLLALPIANPYAGNYSCVGYRIRPGNAPEPVNQVEALKTIDCHTVRKTGFGNYSPYDVQIDVTTDVINVAGTDCFKCNVTVIDPATEKVVGGMWDTWTGDLNQDPKPATPDINYYNPVTKTFVLNAYYVSSAGNRIMYEILTRQ